MTLKKKNTYQHLVFYSVFILLTFIFYGNTLSNGFSMDDELVTSTDKHEHAIVSEGVAGISTIFSSRYANHHQQSYSYRPVTTLSFAIEYDLFKESDNRAKVSHFISVLLYGFSGCALFFFLQTLFNGKNTYFSAFAVLLFMIHPIHSEVVNSIKSRDEMMAFIFGFLMIVHFIRYYDTRKTLYIITTLIFLFLTIFSKETGAIFIALAPVCLYFFREVNIKKLVLFVAAIGLAYLVIDMGTKTMITAPKVRHFDFFENPLYAMDFHHRIPMFFYTIGYYLYLLIKPFPLVYYYGYDAVSIISYNSWKFYMSALAVLGLLAYMVKGVRTKENTSFYILFFFLAIGGASNLIFPLPGIIAERFAFIASAPFCLLLAFGLLKLYKSNESFVYSFKHFKVLSLGLIGIALLSFVYTRERNTDWESAYSIYKADIAKVPNSVKANLMLATEYTDKARRLQAKGNLDEYPQVYTFVETAEDYFNNAIAIYPEGENAYNNLGYIALNFQHNTLQGIEYLEKGVALNPTTIEANFNLGKSYGMVHDYYDDLFFYIYQDSSVTTDSLSVSALTSIINTTEIIDFFQAWQRYQFIAAVFEKVWTPNMNPVMGGVYINFLKHQLSYSENILSNDKRMRRLNLIAQKKLQEQSQLLARELGLMHNELISKSKELLHSDSLSLASVITAAKAHYKHKFYSQFSKLNELAPNYFEQYPLVTQFALKTNNHTKAIEWGHRFLASQPPNPEQAYMQMGFSFNELNQRDSVQYYFDKSIGIKEAILNGLLEAPTAKQEMGKINALKQEIELMSNVLLDTSTN